MEHDLDELVRRADGDDRAAADLLFASLYEELHGIAERSLRRGGAPGAMGATTLLHEAYLNVSGRVGVAFVDRPRFLAYAARAMRGLIVDYARRRRAVKRGHGFDITLVEEAAPAADAARRADDLVRLGDALDELSGASPALAELVDLHFFCGFAFGEIATLRGVSERTVQRDWRKARLLLHHALTDAGGDTAV